MTPREFDIEVRAAQQRWQDESDRDLIQAWRGVAFYTQAVAGKLISLKDALARNQGRSSRQTPDDQRQVLEFLSKQTGFPLKTVH